jgi:hypothetical protein
MTSQTSHKNIKKIERRWGIQSANFESEGNKILKR